jgi:KUP system potassium uptake protein
LIERRIIDSIFSNPPKKGDLYWLVNFERADNPYTMEYDVEEIIKNKVIRVDFRLGFRIQPRFSIMLRHVIDQMVKNKELVIPRRFPTVQKDGVGDFKFIILERFLSYDNEFTGKEKFILNNYFNMLRWARSDSEAYGIDVDQAVFEKVPLVVAPVTNIHLKKVKHISDTEE